MPDSTVTFQKTGGSFVTVNGPQSPTQVNLLPMFVQERSASHKIRSYQGTSTKLWQWVLGLRDLTTSQRTAFEDFFTDTVKGAGETFTYTHTDGEQYSLCRFENTDLAWTRNHNGNWDVSVTVLSPSAPG